MNGFAQAGWLAIARDCAASNLPCALVRVAATRGSAPREAGASMLVTADATVGTIGGGRLEQQAIELARRCMTESAADPVQQTYALGPELGQCCGGSVDLSVEVLRNADAATLDRWASLYHAEQPTAHLYLFGAGHVGLAVARIAVTLPYCLHWIDSRGEAGAKAEAACLPITILPKPALAAESAMPNGLYLVMTHSHALDLDICERILRRGDFAFLGLIGSATKRAKFVQRLRDRGIQERQIARLVCPIGVSGINSKLPAAIAVAAMAQVLTSSEKSAARGLKIA